MMNQKLIEGALGMLARLIPPEEYAKANTAIAKIFELFETIDARAKRTEEAAVYSANMLKNLDERIAVLETAASIDSPAFAAARAELAMLMVPGTVEAALAPAKPGVINND